MTGPDVVPFNPEKQNLLMIVLHEFLVGGVGGDQYFRFGRIQENAAKQAARIQIVNMRVSVAAGLHEVSLPLYGFLVCNGTDVIAVAHLGRLLGSRLSTYVSVLLLACMR